MLTVVHVDGFYQLERADGGRRVLFKDGIPLTRFEPDWQPVGLHKAFGSVLLLELRHVAGHEATWFFNPDLTYIHDSIDMLPDDQHDTIMQGAYEALVALRDGLLVSPRPQMSTDRHEFASLNIATRRRLLERCLKQLVPEAVVIELADSGPTAGSLQLPALAGGQTGGMTLDLAAVQSVLSRDLQLDHLDLVRDGHYTISGLVDGRPLHSDVSIVVKHRFMAYRFVDIAADLVFYLCNTTTISQKEIFIPILNCTITRHDSGLSASRMPSLLDELMRNAPLIAGYLDAPKRTANFMTPYPGLHMGHVLWNELTGLDRIRRAVEIDRLPLVYVQNSEEGAEVYGPVEELMPEYAGRVHRLSGHNTDIAPYVYRHHLTLISAYDDYVSRSLAGHIAAFARRNAVVRGDATYADHLASEGRIFVLLGLRVHNRTMPDIINVFVGILRSLLARVSPLVVVVDGTNARVGGDPSTDYGGFGPVGRRPAIIEELEIVVALRGHFHERDVRIVGTVGMPVASSIFWAQRCRFFVGLWGAGLAKYRWVCNLPGLVLTNRHNLDHSDGDVKIYHAPRFMETPSALRFIEAALVTDEPGEVAFYANFRVEPAGLDAALGRLVEDVMTNSPMVGPSYEPHRLAPLAAAFAIPAVSEMRLVERIDRHSQNFTLERLHAGWCIDMNGRCGPATGRATVKFDLPYRPMHARLKLEIHGTNHLRLLSVSANGWTIGQSDIGPVKLSGSFMDFWIPKEALASPNLLLAFDSLPQPSPEILAFHLGAMAVEIGPPVPEIEHPNLADPDPAGEKDFGPLMTSFESLGDDCEFGFVQRYFGVEPLGIFRFAGTVDLPNLLYLLKSDLKGLGDPGSLSANRSIAHIYRPGEPSLIIDEFLMHDPKLGFGFHTWRGPADAPEEEAKRENEQKLRYLRRKFFEDLEDGEKIWLLKDVKRQDVNEAFAFHAVLNRRSRNKLFWVTRAVDGRPPGSVEWIGPDLLRGYSDQPHIDAQRFQPGTWLDLCRNAWRAFAERER